MTNKTVRIGLGVITHRRLDGLIRLLQSFADMRVPDGVECTVLIAENDDAPTLDAHLETLRAAVPFEVQLSFEDQRGIPFARNHVLDMAIDGGFDFLTFVDDDQVVSKDWLVMSYASIDGRELDLVGGPRIFIDDPDETLSKMAQVVLGYWRKGSLIIQDARQKLVFSEKEANIPIYTNNWILRIAKQQETGVRFDESYRFTGGSDTKFYMDLRDAGGKTGWSSDARTYEFWQTDRLTLGYIYRRRRDQTITNLIRANRVPSFPRASLLLVRAGVLSFVELLQMPIKGLKSLPLIAGMLGRAVGTMRAHEGFASGLYTPPGADGDGQDPTSARK